MKAAFASLLTHGLLVGAIGWFVAHDGGHVEGAAGLAGGATRFNVTMEAAAKPAPAPVEAPKEKIVVAREGLAVPKPAALPEEVKNAEVREIETPPAREAAPSDGTAADAAAGRQGQGGRGNEAAAKVGDSDRTNRLGLYLQKMQRKIQANLGPAGYVAFPLRAKLILELRRDGQVTKIAVVQSSGDADLDRLAIRAVQKSIPFDPWDRDERIELPVVFR